MHNGIPLEAARGGEKTMYPECQNYMKTLPPNPPLSQVLKDQLKAAEEAAKLQQ